MSSAIRIPEQRETPGQWACPTQRACTSLRALAALACLVCFIACADDDERLAQHLQRGHAYAAEERYREAVIEYKTALDIDPNAAEVHFALADVLRVAGDPAQALWELEETLRLDPKHITARIYMSRTYVLSRDPELREQALVLAEEVIQEEPGNVEAWLAKGRAHRALDQLESSLEAFAEAAEIAPETAEPWLRRGDVLRSMNRREDSEQAYRRATELEPGFASWISLAQLLAGMGERDEEALVAYRNAIETGGPGFDVQARRGMANFLLARGRNAEAEALLYEGLETTGYRADMLRAIARFFLASGKPERARQVLTEAAETQADQLAPQVTLGAFLTEIGELDAALAALDRGLAIDPTDPGARLRKAQVLTEIGLRDGDEARLAAGKALLNAVTLAGGKEEPTALLVQGRLALAEGRRDEAVVYLEQAVDKGADSAKAYYLLGAALFQDDTRRSRAALVRALEVSPDFDPARILLARAHAALGDSELALEVGRVALRRRPDDPDLALALAQSLADLERPDEALSLLAALPEPVVDGKVHFAMARLLEQKGDVEGARTQYLSADSMDPNRSEILSALLSLDARSGNPAGLAETSARIAAATRARPDDAGLVALQAQLENAAGNSTAARQHLRRAIELEPDRIASYFALASLLARQGQTSAALGTYEQALERAPDDGKLQLFVGILYEQLGRIGDAMERYAAALEADPSLAVAKNNLAYLLADRGGDLDRALDLAREAKERLPEEPGVADTLGWVLYKKGLASAAVGYLREAERGYDENDPMKGPVRHHLALAYEADGDTARATETLERALRDFDESGGGDNEPAWVEPSRAMLARLRES